MWQVKAEGEYSFSVATYATREEAWMAAVEELACGAKDVRIVSPKGFVEIL